jgi:hypothetical protein
MAVAAVSNSGTNGSKAKNFSSMFGGSKWITVNEGSSTNASFSTLINPDGDGTNYRLATWINAGDLNVVSAGYAEVFIVSGGGSYGLFQFDQFGQGGEGGDVIRGIFTLPVGNLTVLVGAAGVYNGGSGGKSGIGTLQTRQAASGQGYGGGVATSITGTSQTLALSTGYGTGAVKGVVYARWKI